MSQKYITFRLVAISIFAFVLTHAYCDEVKQAELPKGTASVVAYLYDYKAEPSKWIVTSKGQLHSGVISKYSAKLSTEDVALLLAALTEQHQPLQTAFCEPAPHHTLVFYDKDQKILATVSVCFQCKTLYSSYFRRIREPIFSYWDWRNLQKLFEKNGFPILKKDDQYTQLASESQPRNPKGNQPEQNGTGQLPTDSESKSKR